MPELTDAQARELIASATDETLFVEAGAGTGKTTALVSRILSLIEQGVTVSEIAAITFTEKAASELAERVRRGLEERAATVADMEFADRCRTAVAELDGAALQTLHGFATRILSLYPLEAGLPPRFALRDDVEATLAFRDRWSRFRDQLLESPELERVLLVGLTVGLRLKDLQLVADTFNENWERIAEVVLPTAESGRLDPAAVLGPIREVMAARRPGVADGLTRRLDSLAGYLSFLERNTVRLADARSREERESAELDVLRLLSRMPVITSSPSGEGRGRLGNRDYWNDVVGMRACLGAAETARQEMLDSARTWVLCALLPRVRDFVVESARERRAAGELEFHDLLVFARDLLRDNHDVRSAMRRRFTRILIDEFQDTDPIQLELAALLASDASIGGRGEGAIAEPGRLFFVGDPKQSIYRFRRADIDLFKGARAAFGARHVPLTKNFRCRPAIIEWVNQACGEMFNAFGAGPDSRQADWIPLEPGRDAATLPAVQLIGQPVETKSNDLRAADIRRMEAEAVAATVLQAKRENWLARDGKKGTVTRFSDIAILLPTRTNSPAIERALAAADIPTRIESRSLLFSAQEIRDLTNILAAIDDPTDDVSVVAALRSPAFAVDDADLLEHSLAGGRWDYLGTVPDASPEAVREGMAALKDFHGERWSSGIGALVEDVIAKRKMLELAVASPRPREAWRRLRFVAEQARSLGDSGAVGSLRQFVRWLRTQAEERVLIAEAVATEPDDDAVRILTVHAAKGLEFPIVILAGLGIEPRFTDARVAWGRNAAGEDTVAVRTGVQNSYFRTPEHEEFAAVEKIHDWLERDRLFYVAATRAQERLVVSLFHSAQKDHLSRHSGRKCAIAECLHALRQDHPEWETLQPPMAIGDGIPASAGPGLSEADRTAWIEERESLIERLGNAPVVAATTIAHGERAVPVEAELEPHIEDQPWRKGRAGTSVGRAVHAVLQTIDLASGDGLAETARTQAIAEGIANEAPRIARLAENCRNSRAVREALASKRFWREVYVGAPLEGTLVEGFIDLLYETPEGLVIVDYKTDSAGTPERISEAMKVYRVQGAAYAALLEHALGRPVARCFFLFAEPRTEVEVEDLETAKAEVRLEIQKRFSPAVG